MIKRKLAFVIFIVLIPLFTTLALASEDITFKKYLDKANTYIKTYRHFEASDALKKATELGGAKHPSLHMRLGILYYGLGLIPEAIDEGEKAVALAPSSKWYKYDLAKFYYVDKQFDKAEQQLVTLLRLDPGFTLGYYYLADLYFKKKAYDMAWLSLQRARRLGFKSRQLEEKIEPFSSKPAENFEPTHNNKALFRFIRLSTPVEAKETLNEIRTGKLFENLELELKNEQSSESDFGVMMLNELQDEVADSLRNNQPYSPPLIIRTGAEYRIIQRIMPFDRKSWEAIINAAPPTEADNDENSFMVLAETSKPEAQRNTTLSNDAGQKRLFSSKLAAIYAVENWKTAWTEQNVDEYLTAYSNTFTPPGGLNLETWKKKRHRSLRKTSFIHIDIKDLVVETLNEKQLQVTFKQSYESDSYQDVVLKRLTMSKETKGWKIIKEKVIQKLTP